MAKPLGSKEQRIGPKHRNGSGNDGSLNQRKMHIKVSAKKQAETFQGYTVKDMPGASPFDKALNFSLFKRGKITVEYITASAQKRAEMNGHGNNFVVTMKRRKLRALQRAQAAEDAA